MNDQTREEPKKEEPQEGPRIYRAGKFYVPERMMEAIQAYINQHRPVGDFLTAVLCNDLKADVDRADEENLDNLPAFVHYLYNEAPGRCWGSKERVDAWLRGEEDDGE